MNEFANCLSPSMFQLVLQMKVWATVYYSAVYGIKKAQEAVERDIDKLLQLSLHSRLVTQLT